MQSIRGTKMHPWPALVSAVVLLSLLLLVPLSANGATQPVRGSYLTLTVDSKTSGGATLVGMAISVTQNGALITSGYTPLVFHVVTGFSYEVRALDYGQYSFAGWSSGSSSTNPLLLKATLKTPLTITASYTVSNLTSFAAVSSGISKLGLIIPVYAYPGSVWQDLISLHGEYPTVGIRMIINPSNGPSSYDSNYAIWINREQSAGITVLGYVHTGYTSIPIADVEAQISDYATWYGVHGVFLDEMWNLPGQEWYYSTITSYAHSIGVYLVVGNPGTSVSSGYINTVDNIGLYENSGLPSTSLIQSYVGGYPASTFSFITYNDGPLPSQDYFNTMSHYVSWVSVTDYSQAYVYLPSYMGQELSELAAAG